MTSLTSRLAASVAGLAVIGGALALAAPSAGATPTSGTVTAWGENDDGEANVPAAAQSGVTQIAAGVKFALALKTDGSVIGWGQNGNGQTTIPAAAQSGVVAIDAESNNALALKADGSLVHWGAGDAPPTGLTGITQIAATSTGGMVLKSDHTIQAWDNATAPLIADIPATLQGHAVSIAAGTAFGVAVTDTGSVTAWGSNRYLQTDVPVAAQSGVVKVVAMDSGAAAVKSDGSVVTWGSRIKFGATPAAAMSGVVDVATGYDSAVALKSDGSLVAWGPGNDFGQQDIPAVAGYRATSLVEGGYFAMTLHAPLASGPPVINGTPPPAELGQPYDFTVASTGTFSQVTAGTLPAGLSMDSTGRITGTPAKAGRTTVTVTSTTSLGSATAPMTITVQPAHSTNLQFIDPPASVATGALESDQYVRSFAERYNQTLASNLTVGGTTIPAGTKVNVYYVHDDHVGSDNVAHTLTGSEWFGTKVLATATTTADLQATTPLFAAPGTTYPTSTDQGLEFDDSVTKFVDQSGVNYTLNSWTASDAVRIITLAS
jgi:hypothetical protein